MKWFPLKCVYILSVLLNTINEVHSLTQFLVFTFLHTTSKWIHTSSRGSWTRSSPHAVSWSSNRELEGHWDFWNNSDCRRKCWLNTLGPARSEDTDFPAHKQCHPSISFAKWTTQFWHSILHIYFPWTRSSLYFPIKRKLFRDIFSRGIYYPLHDKKKPDSLGTY